MDINRRRFLRIVASAAAVAGVGKPAIIRAWQRPQRDRVHIDFETRSIVKLREAGSHVYFEHPSTDVMCMAWSINDEPVRLWWPHQAFPSELKRAIERRETDVKAWNAMFERLCFDSLMWPYVEVERSQWVCTMVKALACGFPAKLELAAKALRIEERKDTEGAKAMIKLSKPRNRLKEIEAGADPIWWEREDYEELYVTMGKYCIQDVVTERACDLRLPDLPPDERKYQYWLDQIVADRGVRIDQDLARKAIKIIDVRAKEVKDESIKLCGFSPTQPVAQRDWLNKQVKNLNLTSLKKEFIDAALRRTDLPQNIRRVLELRKEGARSANAKYKSALSHICEDGTVKGLRQFYGAHTGRWAGRNPSFDNLKRVDKGIDVDDLVDAIKTGESWIVESIYGNVLQPIGNATRSMIIADEGCGLYVHDLKSIESRVLADLSGQTSTNDNWRAADKGDISREVYIQNAAEWFSVPAEKVDKDQRGWGKIGELLLGFEGGTGALLRGQEKTNQYFREIYTTMYKTADQQMREKVDFLWRKMGTGHEKDWRAARFVVEKWRKKNSMTVKLWKQLRIQSIKCVRDKVDTEYRGIRFHYNEHFQMLECHTGTGRCLYYPFARVVTVRGRKGGPEEQLRASYQHKMPGGGNRWTEYNPYGGLFTENIVQHRARDVMVQRFKPLEHRGFQLLHTIHDENICQALRSLGLTLQDYIDTVQVAPWWSPTLPVAVEAWTGPRYLKSE